MADVLYKYAIDEDNNLFCIDDYDKKRDVVHTYKCPNCGAIMIAKPGNGGKTPHFAHKNVEECNGETYLHKLAKLALKNKWYDNNRNFNISLKQDTLCIGKNNCPLFEDYYCKKNILMSFNLKDLYNQCIEEKEYDGFIADLLITSEKYCDNPIMIEIFVTHKCTENKINSNNRIIEIKIDSIEDIKSLKNEDIIESEKVRFIGFDRKSNNSIQLNRTELQLCKIYSKTGKIFLKDCTCQDIPHKSSNTLFECVVSNAFKMRYDDIKSFFLNKAKQYGAIKKLCHNCAMYKHNDYYSSYICILYKKYNMSMEPEPINALKCSHYKENISSEDEYTYYEDLIKYYILK